MNSYFKTDFSPTVSAAKVKYKCICICLENKLFVTCNGHLCSDGERPCRYPNTIHNISGPCFVSKMWIKSKYLC